MKKFTIKAYSFDEAKQKALEEGMTIVRNVTPSFKKENPVDFDTFAAQMLEKNKLTNAIGNKAKDIYLNALAVLGKLSLFLAIFDNNTNIPNKANTTKHFREFVIIPHDDVRNTNADITINIDPVIKIVLFLISLSDNTS